LTIPDKFDSAAKLARVWRNECLRVIYDRLIDTTDRKIVDVNFISENISMKVVYFEII